MEEDIFGRTRRLFGCEAMGRLAAARVAVFGVGGVGGHVVEALVRSGVGSIDIFDADTVAPSNINRQVVALHSTIGRNKVDVAAERAMDINPEVKVRAVKMFYLPENADSVDLSVYDYVADCIDTVAAKVEIAARCYNAGIPIIACMGAGNRLDPTAFRIRDIYKTEHDPLAKVMRKKLRELGIRRLCTMASSEPPTRPEDGLRTPASNAFAPAAAGLLMASHIIKAVAGI